MEQELEESQGERHQKYRELKKREEQMDEFMRTFDSQRSGELERMAELEASNVALLEKMSRNMARITHLPSREELEQMKDQLKFKSQEMKKSENTTVGLAGEHAKLQQDLQKVEQLESKITAEMDSLRERCSKMEQELQTYSDLDRVKEEGESKRRAVSVEFLEMLDLINAGKQTMSGMVVTVVSCWRLPCILPTKFPNVIFSYTAGSLPFVP